MPVYVYSCDSCGKLTERFFGMSEDRPRNVRCGVCGKRAQRDFAAEHGAFRNTPGNWPMWSDAAGCHPKQIPEAQTALARAGLHAEFNREGQIKFESPGHRKAICEHYGLFDRNGSYGDPQRGGRR